MLSKFSPESWTLWAVVSAVFHIVVMLNYRSLRGTHYYHLDIKEIDHIVFIAKMVRNVSLNCVPCTLYVYPCMSKGVSHLNLLDELITTFGVFFMFFFFIQISSEQQLRRTWSDATLVMWSLIWICTVCQRPTKWRQDVNELNITPGCLKLHSL